jgi:hypothetical protein
MLSIKRSGALLRRPSLVVSVLESADHGQIAHGKPAPLRTDSAYLSDELHGLQIAECLCLAPWQLRQEAQPCVADFGIGDGDRLPE